MEPEQLAIIDEQATDELGRIISMHEPDTEAVHALADELLVRVLRMVGLPNLADAFDRIEKWCA